MFKRLNGGDTLCRQRGAENLGSPQPTGRVRERGKGGLGELESRLQHHAQKGASRMTGCSPAREGHRGFAFSRKEPVLSHQAAGMRPWGECGAGPMFQQQQLGLSVGYTPAAGDLSGAFSWPPHQGKQNRSCLAWLGFAFTYIAWLLI